MKNRVVGTFIIIGSFFVSAVLAQKTVGLQGNITGLETATVYLKKTNNLNSRQMIVDSTRATQGHFEFKRTIPETDFYSVVVNGLPGQVLFIWDGDVTLEGTRDAFREAQVKGSPLTDAWKKFQDEVEYPYRNVLMDLYNERQRSTNDSGIANRVAEEEKKLKQEQYQKVQQQIRSNPNSLLSLYLLNWYWTQFPKDEAKTLYNQLDSPLKSHTVAKRLQAQLK